MSAFWVRALTARQALLRKLPQEAVVVLVGPLEYRLAFLHSMIVTAVCTAAVVVQIFTVGLVAAAAAVCATSTTTLSLLDLRLR